jgi:predicted DsbA family dithiol-disulfide isomerase
LTVVLHRQNAAWNPHADLYREQAPDAAPPTVRLVTVSAQSGPSGAGHIAPAVHRAQIRSWRGAQTTRASLELARKWELISHSTTSRFQPNTVNAHRLMLYGAKTRARGRGRRKSFSAVISRKARWLTDVAVLADIGERAGLDRAELERYLASDEDRDQVLRGDVEAREAGINGVPFFIFKPPDCGFRSAGARDALEGNDGRSEDMRRRRLSLS